jgi:acyl-coenzyme A thioesterase PaaI-like protein
MIVPFREFIGIKEGRLEHQNILHNHLGSIHAGAQFTFAENASGEYLSFLFPQLKEQVIPLLREGNIKYKKEAHSALRSEAMVEKEALERFEKMFKMKNRAIISVNVKLFDEADMLVCEGSFKWFIQRSD